MNTAINNEPNELNTDQKLQLSNRANEIYGKQLKYMQDHIQSLRSLIKDKEDIIENLTLRFDLGVISQDQNRQSDNINSNKIYKNELHMKAEALAQRTTLENSELREMVNNLRDQNFHLRNTLYELQDQINKQVLQINKLEKLNNKQILQLAQPQMENVQSNDDSSGREDDSVIQRRKRRELNRASAARARIHNRRDSSAETANIFGNDNDSETSVEYPQYSPQTNQQHQRKATKVALVDRCYVVSHRRRNSLVEKLLLGIDDEDAKQSSTERNSEWRHVDVLLNFEKLKVADLERELERTLNMSDSQRGKLDALLNIERTKVVDLEKELQDSENMLDNVIFKLNHIQNSVKNDKMRYLRYIFYILCVSFAYYALRLVL